MNPLLYFYYNVKASLFSTGGFGNVPALHSDLLARGWAQEQHFVEAMAVGQLSPGPNGLWVVALGYLVDGLRGALLSAIAICLPPLLVIVVDRVYRQIKDVPAVEGFVGAMGLATVGVFLVVLSGLLHSAGLEARTLLLATLGCATGLSRRVPVLPTLLAAALIGLLWK